MIEAAREGRSASLLVHGEAGMGKTSLLRDAAERATGLRILRARGIESESHLPFAALSELLAPLLDLRGEIPPVQARALGGALALEATPVTDRFAVAAGVLSLLAAAAERQPVLALADDLQWLDEASREALLFAARRLDAEGVVLLFGLRDGEGMDAGVARARRAAAQRASTTRARAPLLAAEADGLAPQVTDKLVAAAGGNPLALREIPRGLSAEQRAGRDLALAPLRPGDTLERAFRRRVDALPEPTRRAPARRGVRRDGARRRDRRRARERRAAARRARARGGGGAADAARARDRLRPPARARGGLPRRQPVRAPRGAPRARRRVPRPQRREGLAPRGGRADAGRRRRAGADGRRRRRARARRLRRRRPRLRARRRAAHRRRPARAARCSRRPGRPRSPASCRARSSSRRRAPGSPADPLLQADLRAMAARTQMRLGDPLRAGQALVREAERVEALDPVRAGTFLLESAVTHMIDGTLRAMADTALRVARGDRGRRAGPRVPRARC